MFETHETRAHQQISLNCLNNTFILIWAGWIGRLWMWAWEICIWASALPLLLVMWPFKKHLNSQTLHFLSSKTIILRMSARESFPHPFQGHFLAFWICFALEVYFNTRIKMSKGRSCCACHFYTIAFINNTCH